MGALCAKPSKQPEEVVIEPDKEEQVHLWKYMNNALRLDVDDLLAALDAVINKRAPPEPWEYEFLRDYASMVVAYLKWTAKAKVEHLYPLAKEHTKWADNAADLDKTVALAEEALQKLKEADTEADLKAARRLVGKLEDDVKAECRKEESSALPRFIKTVPAEAEEAAVKAAVSGMPWFCMPHMYRVLGPDETAFLAKREHALVVLKVSPLVFHYIYSSRFPAYTKVYAFKLAELKDPALYKARADKEAANPIAAHFGCL